jgi:hypothetical protein
VVEHTPIDNLMMFKLSKLNDLQAWLKSNLNDEDYNILPDYEGVPVFVFFQDRQNIHLLRLAHPEWFYSETITNHNIKKRTFTLNPFRWFDND